MERRADAGKLESQRFEGLQLLRAAAAILVAGFHLYATAGLDSAYSGRFLWLRHGEFGVDLFFVISGFIIFYTASRKSEQGPLAFLQQRFFRVFPPYWAVLTAIFLLTLTYGQITGDYSRLPDGSALIVSVLLLPYPDQILIVAWTLTLEVTFYGLFAASYFAFGFRGLLLVLGLWAGVGQVLMLTTNPVPFGLSLIFHSVVLEFLYGVLIAWLVLQDHTRGRFPALLLGIVLFGVVLSGTWGLAELPREFIAGLPSALIVYGVTGWKARIARPLRLAGDASYILYLTHGLQFSVLARLFGYPTHEDSYASDATMLVMLTTSIVVACLLCLWVERPYLAWCHRISRPPIVTG